jgi:hypothetical protein
LTLSSRARNKEGQGEFSPASKEKVYDMTKALTVSKASKASTIKVTNEWTAALQDAATAVVTGKALTMQGKAKGASAAAVMVAAFASDDVATHPWAFDILGKGDDAHTYVRCTGTNELGNDDLAWKRNGQGAISRYAETAYKTGLQLEFFNRAPNASIWTAATNAIGIARVIRQEGMTALVEDGELKLTGGTTEKAEAMRDAKSLAALAKVAKDATGTNRAKPSNDKGEGEVKELTAFEVSRMAVAIVKMIAAGKTDEQNPTLENFRAIARLVASNPKAFEEI